MKREQLRWGRPPAREPTAGDECFVVGVAHSELDDLFKQMFDGLGLEETVVSSTTVRSLVDSHCLDLLGRASLSLDEVVTQLDRVWRTSQPPTRSPGTPSRLVSPMDAIRRRVESELTRNGEVPVSMLASELRRFVGRHEMLRRKSRGRCTIRSHRELFPVELALLEELYQNVEVCDVQK